MDMKLDSIYNRLKEEIEYQKFQFLMGCIRTELYTERTFGLLRCTAIHGLYLTLEQDGRYNFQMPDWATDDWGT